MATILSIGKGYSKYLKALDKQCYLNLSGLILGKLVKLIGNKAIVERRYGNFSRMFLAIHLNG